MCWPNIGHAANKRNHLLPFSLKAPELKYAKTGLAGFGYRLRFFPNRLS
jgi:hypothetical protein